MDGERDRTVGEFLIDQLTERGVRHLMTVPGDTALGFLAQVEQRRAAARAAGSDRSLQVVNFCDEQGAGFAADAYARLNGLGAVCVTWDVGGLKVANPTGEAYAERSPLVVISGAPSRATRRGDPPHHMIRSFTTQFAVFEQLTEAAAALDDPAMAAATIARLLDAAQTSKRPVYLEIPSDLFAEPLPGPPPAPHDPRCAAGDALDPEALEEAVGEALARFLGPDTRSPVILAGVELHRQGLQRELRELVDRTNVPIAANMLGKGVIDESCPGYLGVYWGRLSRPDVRRQVEESDCLLQLGVVWTRFELGFAPPALRADCSIEASGDHVRIGHARYERVPLRDFLGAFSRRVKWSLPEPSPRPLPTWTAEPERPITVRRLYERLDAFLTDDTVVVSDVGDAMFAARDLTTRADTDFFAPAYYLPMGFAVPAAIGAQLALRAAGRERRPLVLVGDGAFQMTGVELSTALRFGCNPIVVLLNNDGYTTERYLVDGGFNDILRWDYGRIADLLADERIGRRGKSTVVATEGDLDAALEAARAHTEGFFLLDVRLDRMDASEALRALWARD